MIVTAETSVRRGRHRRPRPRKVLFAVGGLALAAGVLSLARMTPESGVGGVGTAEADPRQDPGTGTDRSSDAVATVEAVPRVSPSATSVMGGASAKPTAASRPVSRPPSAFTAAPVTTTIPEAPNTPAPTTTPQPPETTTPVPRPTPTPSRSAPPRAPQPGEQDDPALCVPIIGLCVNPLADRA